MNKIQEFWYCVSPQKDIPLYRGEFLDEEIIVKLMDFISYCKNEIIRGDSFLNIISTALLDEPSRLNYIRLLLGISDKRLYLDLTYLAHITVLENGNRLVQERRENLLKHSTAWFIGRLTQQGREHWAKLISSYFIENGLESILNTFVFLSDNQVKEIFNNLIAPKEIQQKQAKYRGHGAEQRVAKSFFDCGCSIYPIDKHSTPMAVRDPNVNLSAMELVPHEITDANVHSFDLIIKDRYGNIRILVQSLIHTSDPGQYGVNKSDETVNIKRLIERYNNIHPENHVYLVGSVDGVGFSENPTGTIIKMLDVFDEFVQMTTMFKVGLFAQTIGLIEGIQAVVLDSNYFDDNMIEYFNEKYIIPSGATLREVVPEGNNRIIVAGRGSLIY